MLDQLSRGRLIMGVGIGGEDPNEWWACGVDPKTRARRTDESMQILRSLWTQEETTFDGKYFKLNERPHAPEALPPGGVTHAGRRPLRRRAAPHRRATPTAGPASGSRRRRFTEAGEKIAEVRRGGRPRRRDVPARHAVLDGRRRRSRRRPREGRRQHGGVLPPAVRVVREVHAVRHARTRSRSSSRPTSKPAAST